jgi:CRP-like cAMP-binding protein
MKDLKLNGQRITEIPVFSNLNEFEGETLLQIVSIKVCKPDEVIFKEGTQGDALCVILEGTVDIVKQVGSGEFKTLARFGTMSAFGEMTLIHKETAERTASAIARERTRLLIIHKDDFQKLIDFGSVIAYKVTFNICRMLSERLTHVDREWVAMMNHVDERTRTVLQEFDKRKAEIMNAKR